MSEMSEYTLRPDMRGTLWDLALYIPTVGFLGYYGLTFWYAGGHAAWAYTLWFLACFFVIVGGGRILRRLLVLPGAAVALQVDRKRAVHVVLKGGQVAKLVQDVRYFKDYAGRSFGLSGSDADGKKWQYVFHRGQFEGDVQFSRLNAELDVFRD
jgi:hypothetical protein